MASVRIFASIALLLSCFSVGNANRFQHEVLDALDSLNNRDAGEQSLEAITVVLTVTVTANSSTPTSPPVLTAITPSPGAVPVDVTSQSQVVTSYIPELTWCVGPPIGFIPLTPTGAPYQNQSTQYQMTVAGTGSCETSYTPTSTTICATTLTGIGSKIAITACDQQVTFSSDNGFTLETPSPVHSNFSLITPAPTVKELVTYYIAPWQSLTKGDTPSDVDSKVCTILEDGALECIHYEEVWQVNAVTQTSTTQSVVDLTTTVSGGPGVLIVQTVHMNITATVESVSLSTTMLLETEVQTETTSKSTRLVTRTEHLSPSPTATVYMTKGVKYKSQPQQMTTIHVTSAAIQHVGTVTRTSRHPRPTFVELLF